MTTNKIKGFPNLNSFPKLLKVLKLMKNRRVVNMLISLNIALENDP